MAVYRATALVLPVSREGRILLLQDQDPARPGGPDGGGRHDRRGPA
jgi:hypothetical protein